jgi:glycosyltransferase AglD
MLSVFVPAYDEEAVLEANVDRVIRALESIDFELFIVDDASDDRTPQIAGRLANVDSRIKCLRYENGPSRRENLAQSFKNAKGGAVAFIDADLSTSPDYLPKMAAKLSEADIVIGSRYLPQSKTRRKLWRLLVSRVANYSVNNLLSSRLTDHQCGLKVFRRDVILKLVDEAGYDSSMRRGFVWDTEILLRAQKHGYRILEVPVDWAESNHSSVKILRDWKMIPYMLRLRGRFRL